MSTETKDAEPELQVKESVDGSAVVDLPDNFIEGDETDPAPAPKEAPQEASAADDDDQDRDDDTEALRAAKRARRKAKRELAKQTSIEKDHRLVMLQRQNEELMERLSVVERKTHGSELARLDKAIDDTQLKIEYAKRKLAEATEAQDGEALAKAQEMWYESRRQLDSLQHIKKAAIKPVAQPQQPNLPDPRLQRLASQWMERNPWYKADFSNTDSKIAKQVDEDLAAEGWDPTQSDYWEELDNRLRNYLSHRYNGSTDEVPSARKPRSVVTSTGREVASSAGGRNTFMLNPEQVRAIKDAGMWDDPQKRARMIKRYAEAARQGNRS